MYCCIMLENLKSPTACTDIPSGYSRHLEGRREENHLPRARHRKIIILEFVALLGPTLTVVVIWPQNVVATASGCRQQEQAPPSKCVRPHCGCSTSQQDVDGISQEVVTPERGLRS